MLEVIHGSEVVFGDAEALKFKEIGEAFQTEDIIVGEVENFEAFVGV